MNILLVNDDGYTSSNLELLRQELSKYGNVTIVAPDHSMSAMSVSTSIHVHPFFHKRGDNVYSIEGTPADCVIFGLHNLGIKFDLVVSGINFGCNITYDIMHSGTIGACVESLMYGVPAIAFSAEKYYEENAKYVGSAMDFILKNDLLSTEYLLSVNFPTSKTNKGIIFSRLTYRNDVRYFKELENGELLPYREVDDPNKYPKDSDVYLLENEYISITPLMKSLYSDDLFEKIKKEKNL